MLTRLKQLLDKFFYIFVGHTFYICWFIFVSSHLTKCTTSPVSGQGAMLLGEPPSTCSSPASSETIDDPVESGEAEVEPEQPEGLHSFSFGYKMLEIHK